LVRSLSFRHETKERNEQRETTPQLAYKEICKTQIII
jgi:hypothetical protein